MKFFLNSLRKIFFKSLKPYILLFTVLLAENTIIKDARAHENATKRLYIVSSINPIYQISSAISKGLADNILIINPKFSEHDYQFRKSDAKYISKADAIFYVNNDLERGFLKLIKSLDKKSESSQLIKIKGIKLLRKRNNFKEIDSHIWLNPENSIKIAKFITKRLTNLDKKNSERYQKNLDKFIKEISVTQKDIKKKISQKNSGFIFYHDGYQYFEDYFAVKPLKVVSHNHGESLSIKSAKEIDNLMKSGSVKCIFGESQDDRNSAMRLARNYKIKFSILDLIGSKNNFGKNGYQTLLVNMSNKILSCTR